MNINNNQHINNKNAIRPNFGSLAVCRGAVMRNLKDGTKKMVPVELHVLRSEDVADIERIAPEWRRTTFLGKTIINKFLRCAEKPMPYSLNQYGTNFFVLKPLNLEAFNSKDPIGFAILTRWTDKPNNKHYTDLCYIQTANEFMRDKRKRQISGCGEMLLYGLAKFMKNIEYDLFHFESLPSSTSFYKKVLQVNPLGFNKNIFDLKPEIVNKFAQRIEEKYGLPKDTEIPQHIIEEISTNSYLV